MTITALDCKFETRPRQCIIVGHGRGIAKVMSRIESELSQDKSLGVSREKRTLENVLEHSSYPGQFCT